MSSALFPGSFDPVTNGHVDIVERALRFFDKLYVAVGNNSTKQYLLPFKDRLDVAKKVFSGNNAIEVVGYENLTVDVCRKLGVNHIIRGLRSGTDFDYEKNIAFMNERLSPKVETVFLMANPKYAGLTATIVREIYRYGGDISQFVPKEVLEKLKG